MPMSNIKLAPLRQKTAVVTYTIAGVITDGEDPLADVQVNLGAYQALTAQDGTFTIAGVPAGVAGTLTPSKDGYTFAPENISVAALQDDLTGQDFTATAEEAEPSGYTISGAISDGVDPIEGVTVALGAYNAVTGADGSFQIAEIPASTAGNLTPLLTGYRFAPASQSIAAMSGNLTGKNFTAQAAILLDNFDGAGAITAHTPDIGPAATPWVIGAGAFNNLASGFLQVNSNSGHCELDCSVTDADVVAVFKLKAAKTVGLVWRVNGTDFYGLILYPDSNWFRVVRGGTNLATIYPSPAEAPDQTYTVKLELYGSLHRLYLDGVFQTEVTSALHTGTKFGIYTGLAGVGGGYADSITVFPAPTWQRLLVIGDSISVCTAGKWPWDFCHALYATGHTFYTGRAASGAKIITEMDGQVAAAVSDNPDLIIIAMGTNDTSPTGIQAKVEANIDTLKSDHPGIPIYCINVLPRWTDNTGATPVDKAANRAAIAAACATKSVPCWDTFTDPWITAADTLDGLHPNDTGNTKINARLMALLSPVINY
jgi:lysophospholipase L1-like esterase